MLPESYSKRFTELLEQSGNENSTLIKEDFLKSIRAENCNEDLVIKIINRMNPRVETDVRVRRVCFNHAGNILQLRINEDSGTVRELFQRILETARGDDEPDVHIRLSAVNFLGEAAGRCDNAVTRRQIENTLLELSDLGRGDHPQVAALALQTLMRKNILVAETRARALEWLNYRGETYWAHRLVGYDVLPLSPKEERMIDRCFAALMADETRGEAVLIETAALLSAVNRFGCRMHPDAYTALTITARECGEIKGGDLTENLLRHLLGRRLEITPPQALMETSPYIPVNGREGIDLQ